MLAVSRRHFLRVAACATPLALSFGTTGCHDCLLPSTQQQLQPTVNSLLDAVIGVTRPKNLLSPQKYLQVKSQTNHAFWDLLEKFSLKAPHLPHDIKLGLNVVEWSPLILGEGFQRFSSQSVSKNTEMLTEWLLGENSLLAELAYGMKALMTLLYFENEKVITSIGAELPRVERSRSEGVL